MPIHTRRWNDSPVANEGHRLLVTRYRPRGVAKEDAGIDLWLKEIAPSAALRRWFAHEPARWTEFRARYFRELDGREACFDPLVERARRGRVTLVYGAREDRCNNAVALKEYLER